MLRFVISQRWNKIGRSALLQPGQRLTLFIDALKI